jgi:Uma2 family endonuclease
MISHPGAPGDFVVDLLISDPAISRRLIRQRRARGIDRKDEVWEGVYILAPPPDDEHQDQTGMIAYALQTCVAFAGLGLVRLGPGVSDRVEKWTKNYRCPDLAVFLNGTTAINKGTHWLGGPDFAIEIISPHDRSRKKLDFYAKVGVRELLLVDRKPWVLELYRFQDGKLALVGKSDLDMQNILASEVVPLTFQLVAGDPRPRIEMAHSDGVQRWSA